MAFSQLPLGEDTGSEQVLSKVEGVGVSERRCAVGRYKRRLICIITSYLVWLEYRMSVGKYQDTGWEI